MERDFEILFHKPESGSSLPDFVYFMLPATILGVIVLAWRN